jgi:hypothetical protein
MLPRKWPIYRVALKDGSWELQLARHQPANNMLTIAFAELLDNILQRAGVLRQLNMGATAMMAVRKLPELRQRKN